MEGRKHGARTKERREIDAKGRSHARAAGWTNAETDSHLEVGQKIQE